MNKIMFNDKYRLTQAVLEGRKTTTRRTIKNEVAITHCEKGYTNLAIYHAPYKVGEIVAVAQNYRDCLYDCLMEFEINGQDSVIGESKGWTNKMFVKADLMPHHIRITGIRVERLQDISDEDCLREGIMFGEFTNTWDRYYFEVNGRNNITASTPKKAFAKLIDKVSGKGTMDSNPWVYVYEFKLFN